MVVLLAVGERPMNAHELQMIAMSLPGATQQIQWEKDRVFKVGGKMFACSGLDADSRYSFKVEDERFLELTDQPGIVPAPYLARARWVQIDPAACPLPDSTIEQLVRRSHALVFERLPRKTQRQIGVEGTS